ncbi:MAG: alpha/beta hydrolase [bacterium]|nr:alpha/beta hydrolase [bacterium]
MEKGIVVNGRNLHCRIFGKGSPAVVLLSGFRAPQTYWDSIVYKIAGHSTVVTYDRPGYGNSQLGVGPVDGITTARELKSLLVSLKLPGPYLIVGHSYGGKISRLFASLFPKDICGIVLIDSNHHDFSAAYRAIMTDEEKKRYGPISSNSSDGGPLAPTGPGRELQALDTTISQLKKMDFQLDVPLVVMTAGIMPNDPFYSQLSKETYARLKMLLREHPRKHFKLSTRGKQVIIEGAGHNIHMDNPGAVINVIVDLLK